MKPIHMNSNKEDIAPLVLLPGDPLRAKYIAENYLEDIKLINDVRNMLGYTGYYKGNKITVMGSGMGIPSVAIYAHELYHFYDVKKIIRIGTAGAFGPETKVKDIILGTKACSHSNFGYAYRKTNDPIVDSSEDLNNKIIETAQELNIPIKTGVIYTAEVFDVYKNIDHLKQTIPDNIKPLASEMEAFGLYNVALDDNKEATCIVSISDSLFEENVDLTSEERQTSLNEMIILALESIIKN
jgi:purine-nucleoside phosphorylase